MNNTEKMLSVKKSHLREDLITLNSTCLALMSQIRMTINDIDEIY